MPKKCVICNSNIEDDFGKLKGTLLKVIEGGKNMFLFVCSDCQKLPNYVEKAKIKGA